MAKTYRYKYIHFKPVEFETENTIWLCRNNRDNSNLAELSYYGDWKKYVATFSEYAVFSADCLKDIQHFLDLLNKHGGALKQSEKTKITNSLYVTHENGTIELVDDIGEIA